MQKRAKSINKSKWVDRDSSLFMESRGMTQGTNQFDNSLMDNEEKMRIQTPSLADNSINELIKRRHNSTERASSKGYRPKSSKGHRGYQTQTNSSTQIPKLPQTKSEERNIRTQGHQRPQTNLSN